MAMDIAMAAAMDIAMAAAMPMAMAMVVVRVFQERSWPACPWGSDSCGGGLQLQPFPGDGKGCSCRCPPPAPRNCNCNPFFFKKNICSFF